jgi:hypothetical protein
MLEHAVADIAESRDEKHNAKSACRCSTTASAKSVKACVAWLKTLDRENRTLPLAIRPGSPIHRSLRFESRNLRRRLCRRPVESHLRVRPTGSCVAPQAQQTTPRFANSFAVGKPMPPLALRDNDYLSQPSLVLSPSCSDRPLVRASDWRDRVVAAAPLRLGRRLGEHRRWSQSGHKTGATLQS